MKKYINIFLYVIVTILFFITVNYLFTQEGTEKERKIVVFKNEFIEKSYKESILKKAEASKNKKFRFN